MNASKKLDSALAELGRLTGLSVSPTAQVRSPEEEEALLAGVRMLTQTWRASHDRARFWQDLLDGTLTDEARILSLAMAHHIAADRERLVLLCDCPPGAAETVAPILQGLFPSSSSADTVMMKEGRFAVVYAPSRPGEEIFSFLHSTFDTLSAEAMVPVRVSCSGPAPLAQLAGTWQECILAMEIGTLFMPGENVYPFRGLGIGKLIWRTPPEASREFIEENLLPFDPEELTDELIETAQCFFSCDLVITAAARQMHMHRNTLLYRLEQIRRITGLDIRRFDEAAKLSLAINILQYLQYRKKDPS